MRVLVCGGRAFVPSADAYAMIARVLTPGDTLIHGAARGADSFAAEFATKLGCQVIGYPADWAQHGRAAGPIRNQRMLEDGKPDLVLAFPGGRGTADMVRRAGAAGVNVIIATAATDAADGDFGTCKNQPLPHLWAANCIDWQPATDAGKGE